jgi:hypothetical protein
MLSSVACPAVQYFFFSFLHKGGKQLQTTPKKLAQDAAYQSHTGHLTGLWFLSKLAQGLHTNYNNIT